MKNLRLRPGLALTLLAAFGSLTSADAALVWTADFQSYTNNSELVVNSTGANDSFSIGPTVQGSSGLLNPAGSRVYSPATPPTGSSALWNTQVPPTSFLDSTNRALRVQIDETVAADPTNTQNPEGRENFSLRFGQSAFSDSTFSSGVQVVSFDSIRDHRGGGHSVNGDVIDGSTTIGARDVGNNGFFRRITIVTNLSGASIALPVGLGAHQTLATGKTITYFSYFDAQNNRVYGTSGAVNVTSVSATLNGFNTGMQVNTSKDNKLVGWFDNFGVWNSPNDLYNGQSILDIAAGTQIIASAIPEPSTFAAVAGLLALGCAATCRRRGSKG